jgi:hypothetical protein
MKMIKKSCVLAMGLLMGAALVVGAGESQAAVPAAPTFNTATKVGDGSNRAPGGKVQATDGTNFYSTLTNNGNLYVVRSIDSGVTWQKTSYVTADPSISVASVAVSGDAVNPSQKIVHVVWEQSNNDGTENVSIYYSSIDNANLYGTWSAPVKINGSVLAAGSWARTSIVTSSTGNIHVLFLGADNKMYYTTASRFDSAFLNPEVLPASPDTWGDIELALDKSNNLHVAYPIFDAATSKFGMKYTKKPSGLKWTTPVDAMPLTAGGNDGFTSIAVYDPNNIYVAGHNNQSVYVARSIDGGKTFKTSTAFAGTATVTPTRHISIAVNSAKALYVGTGFDNQTTGLEEARIFKSTDGGVTWSTGGVIPNMTSVSINFDSKAKAGINLWGTNGDYNDTIYFVKEK